MNFLQFGGLTSTCCLNWLKKLSAKCAHIFNPYRMCQCGALAHIFEPLVDEFGIIFMQGDRVLFIMRISSSLDLLASQAVDWLA